MIKEIALYVDNNREITDLNKTGIIKVFFRDKGKWNVIREVTHKFYDGKENEELKLDIIKIKEVLGNCNVFVAREISDLTYEIFKQFGISMWKVEGNESEILEYIFEKEKEEEEEIKLIEASSFKEKRQTFSPIKIGNKGYYILNLKEIQEHNTGMSTKQVLKPFLINNKFSELIVTCSHIPNWLKGELERLKLNFEFSKTGEDDYIIVINHNR